VSGRIEEVIMGENALQGLRLSEAGKRYLDEHPERAHRVASEAIEAEARREAGMNEIPETLRPFVRGREDGPEIISLSEASRRLSVTRTTLYDWVRKRRLLAWSTSKRGLKIPAEQILGPERIVDGIDQVWAILVDPELVWVFLSEEQPFEDEVARPIDKLKAGQIDDVVGAARAYGSTPA
jgi:excisionase family DNA binding protein